MKIKTKLLWRFGTLISHTKKCFSHKTPNNIKMHPHSPKSSFDPLKRGGVVETPESCGYSQNVV